MTKKRLTIEKLANKLITKEKAKLQNKINLFKMNVPKNNNKNILLSKNNQK